jgi:SAM-dependent methyltransferase
MALIYRIMYRVGFTPWDTGAVSEELAALVEGPDALPPGRALDLGCGTGTHALYLARSGWRVTAIDAVERPLKKARQRAADSGVTIDWIRADVARLGELGLAPGFALFYDRGCFHGLSDGDRAAYASAVTDLAAPGATLLVMAFATNRKLAAPSGADEPEIAERFGAGWELVVASADRGPAPSGPMRDVPLTWYRLRRR